MQFENSINMRTKKKKKKKKTQIITNYLYCYSSMTDLLNPFGSMTNFRLQIYVLYRLIERLLQSKNKELLVKRNADTSRCFESVPVRFHGARRLPVSKR
jgi:hypothetical protein